MLKENNIMVRPLVYAACSVVFVMFFSLTAMAVEYRVGEGDVLNISVYGHNDLKITERISGDGRIILPLIGQLDVNGLTITEVTALIANRLASGYIVSPQVSVFVNEFRSRKAVIMGEIAKPGLYELKGEITLLELISIAGGLAPNAGEIATIKRTGVDGKVMSMDIDYKSIMESGDVSLDVNIYDDDSIYISKAGIYYITGEVKKPDAYKFTEGITVIKAITRAGGFTEKASERKVRVIRKVEGRESVIENVSMDEFIIPEDVIVIPESLF
jgi:polysaccharide export outer membrane protein